MLLALAGCKKHEPPAGQGPGRIITAASANFADVNSAIALANDGDTVAIPVGSATWSGAVTVSKAITLQGAGVGETIISAGGFKLQTTAGKFYRVTGFEFRGPGNGLGGVIVWAGTSHSIRVDHNFFNLPPQRSLYISNWALGVIDHNTFHSNEQKIFMSAGEWGGKSNGDGSWAAPSTIGTQDAVYIEDNFARSTGPASRAFTDAEFGARFVVRRNELDNSTVNNHGTQGDQQDRACFSMEVYENTFTNVTDNHLVDSRGGNGVTWGNTATGGVVFMHLNDYRANNLDNNSRWGTTTGFNKLDDNYPGAPFETGTHTGSAGVTTLTDNTKSWTPNNKWRGYSVSNLATGRQAVILSSTATSLTYGSPTVGAGTMTWSNGDSYRIGRVRSAIDMCGMGTGDLLNRTTMVWPNQKIEGVYAWDNLINGRPAIGVAADKYPYIQEGVHFFNLRKPGYTPFVYPHPLVSGAATTPTPTPTGTPTPATPSPSPSPSATPTPTPSATASPTPTPTATLTPSPSPLPSPSEEPSSSPSPSPVPTDSPTPEPSETPSPSPTVTPSPLPTETPTPTPTPEETPSPPPSPSVTPSATPEPSETPSASPSPSVTPTPSPTPKGHNHRPRVKAGVDQIYFIRSGGAHLQGNASDDGLPDPPARLSYTWSRESGPGPVTFSAPDSLETEATFGLVTGTYKLKLRVSDGQYSNSDTVNVTVKRR